MESPHRTSTGVKIYPDRFMRWGTLLLARFALSTRESDVESGR